MSTVSEPAGTPKRPQASEQKVAVLGAGAGGLSCVVELTLAGHHVRLWSRGRRPRPIEHRGQPPGGIAHAGVLGDGQVRAALVTTDLAEALCGADVVVVCLPALAHAGVFAGLASLGCSLPVVLNPGHTGGALHLRRVFCDAGVPAPPVAELSTLTYVARRLDGVLRITGRARQVRCGSLPGGSAAASAAAALFPGTVAGVPDVLASSLSNVNLVLHPPGAILAAAWTEATGGCFTFYVDAMTSGVGRVIDALDLERRAVAAAFGHELPSLTGEMALIGTVPSELASGPDGTAAAVRAGEANKSIKAPDSLRHRYYLEDFPYAITPLLALARIGGVRAPVAEALLTVAGALLGPGALGRGLDAEGLGVAGLGVADLLGLVRG